MKGLYNVEIFGGTSDFLEHEYDVMLNYHDGDCLKCVTETGLENAIELAEEWADEYELKINHNY